MDVKQAVALAKNYLADLLADERVSSLTLEEIWFDDSYQHWCVTIGVHRGALKLLPDYKLVRISDKDGRVLSVKNRANEAA